MVSINIAGLSQGLHDIVLEPGAEELSLSPDEYSDIYVDLRLDHEPGQLLMHLKISSVAGLVCDRTLVPFRQPIEGSYTVLFTTHSDLVDADTQADDVVPLDPNARELDLTGILRDTLLLSVPLRKVAPEAEHDELRLSFGPDENETDPRWDALKQLK